MTFLRIALYFIATFITACGVTYTSERVSDKFYTPGLNDVTSSDSLLILEIAPYKIKLDSSMNEVLAISSAKMEKGQPESELGNFVADLCMDVINNDSNLFKSKPADFCVLNNGGLRASLPAGNILLKNAFELMPFENELVIITLNGVSVQKVLNYISEKGGVPVSNLRMKLNVEDYTNVTINNLPFSTDATYRVLTSDYLANGGDAMNMFGDSLSSESTGTKVRDAIISYLRDQKKAGQVINPKTDGRISK